MGIDSNISIENYLDVYGFTQSHYLGEARSKWVYGPAGKLATYELRPAKSFKGHTFFVVHGYFEHTAWMQEIIFHLLKYGYRVIAFDLPGHGLSEGDRGDIHHFSDYALSFKIIYDYFFTPHQEFSYLGYSTGATPIVHWALVGGRELGIFPSLTQTHLFAPLIKLSMDRFTWIPMLYHRATQNYRFPRRKNYKALEDPLAVPFVNAKWLFKNRIWHQELITSARPFELPNLYIWTGDSDSTVHWDYNLNVFKKYFKYQVKIFKGIGHRIVEVPHVLDDFELFLKKSELSSR